MPVDTGKRRPKIQFKALPFELLRKEAESRSGDEKYVIHDYLICIVDNHKETLQRHYDRQ